MVEKNVVVLKYLKLIKENVKKKKENVKEEK